MFVFSCIPKMARPLFKISDKRIMRVGEPERDYWVCVCVRAVHPRGRCEDNRSRLFPSFTAEQDARLLPLPALGYEAARKKEKGCRTLPLPPSAPLANSALAGRNVTQHIYV